VITTITTITTTTITTIIIIISSLYYRLGVIEVMVNATLLNT